MSLEQDVQMAVDALLARLREAIDRDVRTMASELVARAEAERQALLDDVQRAADLERTAAVSRLLDAVRHLDAQPTLTDVLDTLTELVAEEAGRAAVFVASDGDMRGWRFAGFGPEAGEARSRILKGSDAGFLSLAIGSRQTRVLPAGRARIDADRPPAFTALPGDRSALAVPVLIGGETMVLVYADDVHAESQSILSQWSDAVELLARHAGHRLAALTADRAVALATGNGAIFQPANVAGSRLEPAPGIGKSEADEAARRYARLLVSEIKLYNEGAVTDGRAERDLYHRLKGEIDRARSLYEERIPSSVHSRYLFFDQELVRTLADGDPSLLGT